VVERCWWHSAEAKEELTASPSPALAAAVLLPALGKAARPDKGKRGGGSRTKAEPFSLPGRIQPPEREPERDTAGTGVGKSHFVLQPQHLVESRVGEGGTPGVPQG